MKKRNIGILVLIVLILSSSLVMAQSESKTIEVFSNKVNIEVNGEGVSGENILYGGVTYVPLREISNMLNNNIKWNQDTNTASIISKESESNVSDLLAVDELRGRIHLVDEYKSLISFGELIKDYNQYLSIGADEIIQYNTFEYSSTIDEGFDFLVKNYEYRMDFYDSMILPIAEQNNFDMTAIKELHEGYNEAMLLFYYAKDLLSDTYITQDIDVYGDYLDKVEEAQRTTLNTLSKSNEAYNNEMLSILEMLY